MRTVFDMLRREHDGAGAVFDTFLLSTKIFGAPEIRISNNEAGLRLG
jgi:hypothetical protein